jgi:hypothetical protein
MANEPNQQLATINVGSKGLALSNINEMWRFAQVAVQSNMAPKGIDTPQKAMICLQAGAEVGLPPWASLRGIAVINNRPCLYGDQFLGVIQARPECEWVQETSDGEGEKMVATCTTKRRGKPETTRRFSVDDAKKAKLWNKPGPWQDYPQRMLQMRARSWCLRDSYSDFLSGMAMVEEVQDYDDDPKPVAVTVTNVDPPRQSRVDALVEKLTTPAPEPDPPAQEVAPETNSSETLDSSSDLLRCPKCQTTATWSESLSGRGCPSCGTKGVPA